MYTEFLICTKKILMYIVRTDSFHLKLSINTSKLANLSLKNCMQQWLTKAISIYGQVNVCCRLAANLFAWLNVCRKLAAMFTSCLQKCLPQVCSNNCGKFAANVRRKLFLNGHGNVCCKLAADLICMVKCLLQACGKFAACLQQCLSLME